MFIFFLQLHKKNSKDFFGKCDQIVRNILTIPLLVGNNRLILALAIPTGVPMTVVNKKNTTVRAPNKISKFLSVQSICLLSALLIFSNILLTVTVFNIFSKYAPIKRKCVRANEASFMTKELHKAIMKWSRLRNEFLKDRTENNQKNFKLHVNFCKKLQRTTI